MNELTLEVLTERIEHLEQTILWGKRLASFALLLLVISVLLGAKVPPHLTVVSG